MNGVKPGITSSEGQLAIVASLFTMAHDKLGFELNEASLDVLMWVSIAYIVTRGVVKAVATWKGA